MSKKKTYFSILIAAVVIIALAYLLNIGQLKSFLNSCAHYASNNWLSTTAAVCAFVFLGNRNYWLLMLGCALATAIILQLIKMSGLGLMATLAMIISFVAIVFVMNLIKLVINK